MRLNRRCELFATTRSKWPFICFGFYRLWYLKHLFPDKQGVRYFDSWQCQWTQTEKNKAAAMEKPELWSIRKPTAGSNKHSKSFWTLQMAQRTSQVFTLSFCPHITKLCIKGYHSLWNNLSVVRMRCEVILCRIARIFLRISWLRHKKRWIIAITTETNDGGCSLSVEHMSLAE